MGEVKPYPVALAGRGRAWAVLEQEGQVDPAAVGLAEPGRRAARLQAGRLRAVGRLRVEGAQVRRA